MSESRPCTTEYQELISGYLDGDLDAAERQQLLDHLSTCPDCRLTIESYRQIGNQVRSLPRSVPPPELRDAIYASTIRSNSGKVYYLSSRLGYSMAAIAAVALLFIVAAYLLVNGYQRTIDPEIVATSPGNGMIWPLSRPIEITFNKEMDRESVESALSIVPASEKDRLSRTWSGNTLVLGANQTLHSSSSYTILITTNAEDKWGKNLGSSFKLQFETSESFALQTPEPIPTPTSTPESTATPTETSTRQSTATPTAESQPVVEPTAEPTEQELTQPTEAPSEPSATPIPSTSQPPSGSDPDPTATVTPLPPTPTDEPEPTATSSPTPRPTATPAPTWTPRPIPSPTATTPPATATPVDEAPTATPDSIPVVGAFGNVYWGNEIVLDRLGSPTSAASSITGVELDFQHGAMFSRSDTSQTYVLESAAGLWSVVPSSSDSTDSEPGPVTDTWIPGGSLGALWSAESWIQAALGYALAPSGSVFDSRVQTFDSGVMLMSSSGQVYVIYTDASGTWELYPDPGS